MKTRIALLFSVVGLLALSGCGGGSGGVERTAWDVRKDMVEVQQELNRFAQENDLTENPTVQAAEEAYFEAVRQFNQRRREHPELASFYQESDAAQSEAIERKLEDDTEGYNAAMDRFKRIRTEMESKANELPEMKALAADLQRAERESVRAMAGAAAAVNAQGRKLAARMEALLDELE